MADIVELQEKGVPKYIKTHITAVDGKASESDVVTGTNDTNYVTPKGVKAYYDEQTKEYVVKYSGLMEGVQSGNETWRTDYFESLSAEFRRIGNRVQFYCRANWKKDTGSGTNNVPTYDIPTGFKITSEWNDTIWNVPLAAAKYAAVAEQSFSGFAERSATNLIRLASSAKGNTYYSGEWVTDDPFPSLAES